MQARTNLGYYALADGTTLPVAVRITGGVTHGCNFGTLLFKLGYALQVLMPLQEEFKGKQVIAICIHDDSAHRDLGEPNLVCQMMTRTMELPVGKQNLQCRATCEYGDTRTQLPVLVLAGPSQAVAREYAT